MSNLNKRGCFLCHRVYIIPYIFMNFEINFPGERERNYFLPWTSWTSFKGWNSYDKSFIFMAPYYLWSSRRETGSLHFLLVISYDIHDFIKLKRFLCKCQTLSNVLVFNLNEVVGFSTFLSVLSSSFHSKHVPSFFSSIIWNSVFFET